ncbi:hypothetical protein [Hyphomonas sp.]|uniref:DoxX family protein n=1 Tax=Hyphomonas sp. TaxID=87 RepID=UPI0030F4E94D
MLKPLSLLILRLGTGGLMVLWGMMKVAAPASSIGVSQKYYGGALNAEMIQMPLGALQVALGVAVILGLWRKVTYPAVAVVIGVGLVAIWKYIVDPMGLYLLTEGNNNPLFFPSLTVFGATLALMAFRADDAWSLDAKLFK